jgi:hypothetical protein
VLDSITLGEAPASLFAAKVALCCSIHDEAGMVDSK